MESESIEIAGRKIPAGDWDKTYVTIDTSPGCLFSNSHRGNLSGKGAPLFDTLFQQCPKILLNTQNRYETQVPNCDRRLYAPNILTVQRLTSSC
jgi:hypothetical protein